LYTKTDDVADEDRPGAQVAGELAISLVDAACVLEMFITVVLVGKHLATAFTLVPGTVCEHTKAV